MKYILYLRVSTDQQDAATQLHHCLAFIRSKDHSNFQHVVFTDSISSRKPLADRPGMQQALAAVEAGDILVAMRIDRIARKSTETHLVIDFLESKKANIILVQQPGIQNLFLLSIYAAMAEEEGKTIRQRTREKLAAKKSRGERIGGIPYGYKLDPNRTVQVNVKGGGKEDKLGLLIPDEKEYPVLQLMHRLHEERESSRMITQHINQAGHRNRKGNCFQHTVVYKILRKLGRTTHVALQPQQKAIDLFL